MNQQEPKDLDHFLGDLRRALKAQERYLLNVLFQLQFPELEGGLEPGFDRGDADSFAQWLSDKYVDQISESVFFRRLLIQQEQLTQQATQQLDKAQAGELDSAGYATFLRAVQRFNELADQLRTDVTSSLIELDELTGLFNRNVMDRDLTEELEHSRRSERSFAVAMLDIDHFKKVNDTQGHAFGDQVLVQLAEAMEDSLRPYDRVYRYGGEEFLILLQDTRIRSAEKVLERLRQAIASREMGTEDLKIEVTVSMGVADSSQFESVQDLVETADKALYKAKENGRNRVEVA
ncbi:GGDEF domain-containing protein [Marinospirillum sp.]|uniref:GGDEF domain-containing protein n=1 Tax=Marinospirillum sp. TaxID=2183934 RepID=UPI00286FB905|nr:GGDEF domain-containing protein [Marinospirillum sp.]MDR9468347.1 GGDEF domain-containing protein [Marinospirillum sp.]